MSRLQRIAFGIVVLSLSLSSCVTAAASGATAPIPVAEPKPCSSRALRTLKGAGIGFGIGAVVGLVHGALDHPGLPHREGDIPPEFEYSPQIALAGLLVGGVAAYATHACD